MLKRLLSLVKALQRLVKMGKSDLRELVTPTGAFKRLGQSDGENTLLLKKRKRDSSFKQLTEIGCVSSKSWRTFSVLGELVDKLRADYPKYSMRTILDLLEKTSLNIPDTISFLNNPRHLRFFLSSQ